ncbi:UDP-N-acetylglucosamine 2-epimerase [Steroidobacter denitrificans]|uniref:UDP-N-acetylglucosamine 2-epimerase n=1 Tax=Steroidobacter denitrificans TaxID=465721 RepID=A0A127F917_STEDE|nr:UDP-N-acetylglucosamine 2-epimerase (non-hydrolyzing) [Steroidobacter denitrificans]AMN46922.1 UDP-N-acetylglucosamine 2-epimerase [Steroidobacter denitrificans]
MNQKRVLSIFGTRPEAIKMAPVVRALAAHPGFDSRICVTAQHRGMLDQVLGLFEIKPDYDLNIMSPGQDLFDVTSRVLLGLRAVIRKESPDIVLVQGDTTTCFAGALAAFYEGVAVAHVEAGLRTGNLRAPFPEEVNRTLVSRIAELHFAPTDRSRRNLLAENIPQPQIIVTGNTVIDALLWMRERVGAYPRSVWKTLFGETLFTRIHDNGRRRVLITGHRRENFGQGFKDLCQAIRELAMNHADWDFIYPVHLNPNVRQPVNDILLRLPNVHLIEPLDYAPFVWLMNECDLILTDSGGVQEEAPSLGKPVLVMREVTERPEAVEAGTVRLVGTDKTTIIAAVEDLLGDPSLYERMSRTHNPYGNGHAAERIVQELAR